LRELELRNHKHFIESPSTKRWGSASHWRKVYP
jgi:hypothetical protein